MNAKFHDEQNTEPCTYKTPPHSPHLVPVEREWTSWKSDRKDRVENSESQAAQLWQQTGGGLRALGLHMGWKASFLKI